ncbi:hypothetical protein Tco_0636726 [Tanacetum coccineum]
MSPPIRRKYHDSVAFATGCKRIKNSKRCNRKIRIPIAMWPCRVEEKMTLKEVDGQTVEEIETKIIAKDGTITRVPGKFQGYETSEEEPVEQPRRHDLYGFVDHPQLQQGNPMNEFAPHRLPQPKGNMNGWLIEDEEEVERNEVDSDLESTASSKPVWKKTTKADHDRASLTAKRIIRDPKLELESSRFTFDLVPLSYESVDVVVGENWLLRHKAEMVCHEKVVKMPWSCKVRVGSNGNLLWEASVLLGRKKGGVHGDDVAKTVFRMRNGHVEVYGYAFWVNQCTSGFHGVNEPGGVRVAREDDRGVTEGREDVREVFQQRGSGAKRKLSRCGRNQMGNEPILALPEGADDFVVYYDARSKDLEACLEKGRSEFDFEAKYHLGKANVVVESWSRKKSEAKNEFWIDRGPELTWERKDQMRSKCLQLFVDSANASSNFVILCVLYVFGVGYVILDNQSIERDRLNGIGFVLNFVKFISFTFGDKEMILVIEAVSR